MKRSKFNDIYIPSIDDIDTINSDLKDNIKKINRYSYIDKRSPNDREHNYDLCSLNRPPDDSHLKSEMKKLISIQRQVSLKLLPHAFGDKENRKYVPECRFLEDTSEWNFQPLQT